MLNRMLERLVWRCWCWSLDREAWICVAVVDLGTVTDSNFLLERPGQCCWCWPLVREVGMFALLCWWGGLQPAGFHAQLPSLFLLTHTHRELCSPGHGTLVLLFPQRENSDLLAWEHFSYSYTWQNSVLLGWNTFSFSQRTLFILAKCILSLAIYSHWVNGSPWQSKRFTLTEIIIHYNRVHYDSPSRSKLFILTEYTAHSVRVHGSFTAFEVYFYILLTLCILKAYIVHTDSIHCSLW